MYSTTIVSGYWVIPNKHQNNSFLDWFKNSLRINCPYVFFGNKESIEIVKKFREELPTTYIEMEIKDFYTYKFYDNIQPHEMHCPSKELNMIWNEKVFLMKKAAELNPYDTEWFAWSDAGICVYRNKSPPITPWPSSEKLQYLDKNCFNFSSSESPIFMPQCVGQYYHFISGTYVCSLNFIKKYAEIYQEYLDKYLSQSTWIYTDQVIHTLIYRDLPHLFKHICHDYGTLILILE